MDFASDNTSGVAPQVMAALNAANEGHVPSYGADALSEAVRTKMRDLFEAPEAAVYLGLVSAILAESISRRGETDDAGVMALYIPKEAIGAQEV